MSWVIWILTVVLLLVGLAGVVIPLLPGTTLILLAVIGHKLLLPDYLTWWTVAAIGGLWVLSLLIDLLGTTIGARLGGGGRWGMAGAAAGSMVGVLISIPAILLGSMVGAALAEKLLARRDSGPALMAGLFAGLGFLLATFLRVVVAFVMLLVFALDCVL